MVNFDVVVLLLFEIEFKLIMSMLMNVIKYVVYVFWFILLFWSTASVGTRTLIEFMMKSLCVDDVCFNFYVCNDVLRVLNNLSLIVVLIVWLVLIFFFGCVDFDCFIVESSVGTNGNCVKLMRVSESVVELGGVFEMNM